MIDEHGVDLNIVENSSIGSECTKLDVFFFFRHILGRLPSNNEWAGHCATFVGKQLESLDFPAFTRHWLIPKNTPLQT